MGARSDGREAALQMLFAIDMGTHASMESVIRDFWALTPSSPEARTYADSLVRGCFENLGSVDETIRHASTHWRIERMSTVDRALLRLGTWELRASADVPAAVVLDEAVELAKRFGSEQSSAFVNGVLDRIAKETRRSDS